MEGKTVAVVVLGDLAQSPRMIAHALALAASGAQVRLAGYVGDAGLPDLPAGVRVHPIAGLGTRRWGALPRPVYLPLAGLRAAIMALRIRHALGAAFAGADLVLFQAPPVVPALPLALMEARRRGIGLVIDWHNLSHAMLALRLGARHPLVGALRRAEGRWGRRAAGHLAVTPILADRLAAMWGIAGAAVLPDRPLRVEAPLVGEERRAALARVVAALGGDPALAADRVVVSPTSWSLDEDMGMALDAAAMLDPAAGSVLLVATGRGPGREAFVRRAHALQSSRLQVLTGWLCEEDFRLLLRAADMGISLHRSASEADFPMKISDMVGAGLPILALDYGPGLRAGLPPAPAAATFRDAAGLAHHLSNWQRDDALAAARRAAAAAGGGWNETWAEAWDRCAAAVLAAALGRVK